MSTSGWWIVGASSLGAVWLFSRSIAPHFGEALVRNTIRLSLMWYFVSICLLLIRWPGTRQPLRDRIDSSARWCSTWGVVAFLVHVASAFHFYHHWSHAEAMERTREVSGVGEGIYASYLFAILWVFHVTWWWQAPQSFGSRHWSLAYGWHIFTLFIIFNATIVFEDGLVRWIGISTFLILGVMYLLHSRALRQDSTRQILPDSNNATRL